jgi:hypothetical protein
MALKCFIVEAALANIELLHATDYTTAILPYTALGYKLQARWTVHGGFIVGHNVCFVFI